MSDELCLYEVRPGGVGLLTLNRPDRNNGMNGNLELAYFRALERAQADREVRAIVVTGAGRAFCPGADLGGARQPGDEPLPNSKLPTSFPLGVDKPMIAAVNGACAGVGLVQALQCDVRFGAKGVKFTTAFARRGLIAEYGIAWLLSRTVGRGAAADLLLSGRVFTSEEAFAIGLLNRLCEPATLVDEAVAYAADLAANVSPASMATMKEQLRLVEDQSFDEALELAHALMRESLTGPDVGEGIGSYLERRDPAFLPLGEGTTFGWMKR